MGKVTKADGRDAVRGVLGGWVWGKHTIREVMVGKTGAVTATVVVRVPAWSVKKRQAAKEREHG